MCFISGGGMVFPKDGIWQLRGFLSLAAADPVTHACDPKEYFVLTDVSKYVSWVNAIVFG